MNGWPDFFIAGVPKAGTTSLHAHLGQHPDIKMSPMKEPHFFSQIRPSTRLRAFFKHISDPAEYQALFGPPDGSRLRGEASTSYFWDEQAPFRIREVVAEPKFIILLRNPIARAHSHYLDDVREGIERRDFFQALSEELSLPADKRGWGRSSLYIDNSLYAERLRRYFEIFGRERVLVLLFEEFIASTRHHLKRVFRFLGVDASIADEIDLSHENPYSRPRGRLARAVLGSSVVRVSARLAVPPALRQFARSQLLVVEEKPAIDAESRELLQMLFREDVRACKDLLGLELPWEREWESDARI